MTENKPFFNPGSFLEKIRSVFRGPTPAEHINELEEAMIEADISLDIVEEFSGRLKSAGIKSFDDARLFLKKSFIEALKSKSLFTLAIT
ncbi:MAG TPA: signal recognition particle receptor subunit alpha, partial [Candidatus Goldiibacteriota bacterium]|nr:signal recognition particle receptor subunit alpha [Candidatus Goldiibacteriota bacterium]